MRGVDRIADFHEQPQDLAGIGPTRTGGVYRHPLGEICVQRFAGHEIHGQIVRPVGSLTAVQDRDDIGMVQRREDLRFPFEAGTLADIGERPLAPSP